VQSGPLDARLDGSDDDALELARAPRVDQLSAERAQQCLRNGWKSELSQPLEANGRFTDQRIACETPQELGVIGVEREHESELLQSVLARCA
jgi:hypothetical protein